MLPRMRIVTLVFDWILGSPTVLPISWSHAYSTPPPG
jgi:hypothetical protein